MTFRLHSLDLWLRASRESPCPLLFLVSSRSPICCACDHEPCLRRQFMRRASCLAVSLASLLMIVSVAGAQAPAFRPFTVDDLLKVKRISDPRLSPDGTRVAYVLTEVDQQNNTRASHVWIIPTAGGEPARLLV